MQRIVLSPIPVEITMEEALKKLGFDDSFTEELEPFYVKTVELANPKAVLKQVEVSGHTPDGLAIDGVWVDSRVMAVNLSGKSEAVCYVVTCGRELHDLSQGYTDSVERFWQDSLNELVLSKAVTYVNLFVERELGFSPIHSMAPGSLKDWPIVMQRPLFKLIGNVIDDIGVELTESCLMVPIKSVSGIFFQSDEHYTSCMLCPRENCPNRRDPFDAGMYQSKYGMEM